MPVMDTDKRMAARTFILGHTDAMSCTVYRLDETDPEAEEEDLGDGKVLFNGQFQAPVEWDAEARDDFYGDADPGLFFNAFIESEAKPGSKAHFDVEIGDYIATLPGDGEVVMYYVYDAVEDESGRLCILIRDEEQPE